MSRDNAKKYPRTIESKNSYLRIRAPEHLDVALEGLIRKVLKEQPKMDDIYAFAADYFDMLLKLREKSGIRKLSVQDICPHHNEEDANEMIKLASTFTKRKKESKPSSRSYKAVTLRQGDHRQERKGTKIKDGDVKTPKNGERFNTGLPIVNEHPELEDAKPVEAVIKNEKLELDTEESDFEVQPICQDVSEKIIEAREVILEEDAEEENADESGVGALGDINEIRDKIKLVEKEIKTLEKRDRDIGKEGNATIETVEEVKVEDANAVEQTPIIEEPLQESEDVAPSAETDVTIQGVIAEDVKKEIEGEKTENTEEIQEAVSGMITESVAKDANEGKAVDENAVQEEEEQKLDIKTEETEEKTVDKTAAEETQESDVDNVIQQTEESSTVEETVEEETPNDEVIVQETQEADTVVERTEEPGAIEESPEEKVNEEVTVQELQEAAQDSDIHVEETAPKVDELTEESTDTGPKTEVKEEDLEMKREVESESEVKEQAPETGAKEKDIAEEQKETESAENEDAEEVNPNTDSAAIEMRSIDPANAEEAELMRGDEPKDDKTETEKFINLEQESQNLQMAKQSNEEIEAGPTNEQPTDNEEKTETAAAVVINVPENGQEKTSEEESLPPTGESNETEGIESAVLGAIAAVGGLGASASVLDQAKRELTDSKPEETTEKEEKTEEADPEPSSEDQLLGGETENEEMTVTAQVQKFLDRERQLSSYDKESEVLDAEEKPENQKLETPDIEIMRETVPAVLARMTLPENEESAEKAQSGPSNAEAEGDEQEREGSTTSDEIEFEVSPLKYPEQGVGEADVREKSDSVNGPAVEEKETDLNAEDKTDSVPEPRIVLELNRSESEDQINTDNTDEAETEPIKVFLSVPETVVEEYPGTKPEDGNQRQTPSEGQSRSKRSVDASGEEAINAEEVIIDCANVGNEIIQTGEVQKVELIEGDEDILQVHLTTTIETTQEDGDSLHVQMKSKIDPTFEVSMETKVESPAFDEKLRLIRAAVVIQNGFRRFRKRKVTGEPLDASADELDSSIVSETKPDPSMQTFLKDASSRESGSSFSSSATKINNFKGRNLSRSATRTFLETHSHSSDPIRKITPLKTRSMSSVRYGVADFEVWNQLVKELEKAATKIQSNYRGYKTRKKLQRGNAIQSTTTTASEDSTATADTMEVNHRHTGEFHDSIVLPPPSK